MVLIRIEDDMPVFNSEVRMIKQFKRLLERDKGSKGDHDGRKKNIATKELAFVHFWCVYDSRFDAFIGSEKTRILKEHLDLPEKWKVDDDIKEAVKEYKFLTYTPAMSLYESMIKGVKKTQEFIEDVDVDERTKSGGLVFSADKLDKVIKGLPDTIKSLIVAENLIRKEQEDKADKKNQELSSGDKEGSTIKVRQGY